MKKLFLAISALAFALGTSLPAYALTQASTMPVSVTLVPTASVLAGSLDFGSLTPLGYGYANTNITVNVGSGTPYTVTLDGGLSPTANERNAKVAFQVGGFYWLFSDPARTQEWGDAGFANTYTGGGAATGVTGTGTGANQNLAVYGSIWARTTVGTFSDTVTVTVHY